MEILETTGLASGWIERTSTCGPSEPLASLSSPMDKTAALNLIVKQPFTDQPDKGVLQTSTTLVSCKSTNTMKSTMKDYMRNYAAQDCPSKGMAGLQ